MSIEQYLLQTDPFRSTTSSNPLPYPLMSTRGPEEIIIIIKRVRHRLDRALLDLGISRYYGIYVEDLSKPGYPGGDEPVTTLCVEIDVDSDSDLDMGIIKDVIHDILSSHGLSHLRIEVVDRSKCFQPSLFPILLSHPAVSIYRSIRNELAETLSGTLGRAWRLMCLFLVGIRITEVEATPSIVVMVEPGTQCDWSRLEGSVMAHLPNDLAIDINVEFLPGSCGDIPPSAGTTGISFRERIAENWLPEMGCSVGVEGEETDPGALEGFVTLKIINKIHKRFLTTHNVVQQLPSNNARQAAARYGYSYFSTSASASQPRPGPDVHFLAAKDTIATIEDLESSIASLSRDMDHLRTRQPTGREDFINQMQATITSYRKMLEKVRTMPKVLGRVLVSSGRAVARKKTAANIVSRIGPLSSC